MTRDFKKSRKAAGINNLPLKQIVVLQKAKLEEVQKEWEIIFNAIEEAISIHDTNFNILRANQSFARILNTTLSDLIGKKCYKAVHCLSEPPKGCPLLQVLEAKRFANAEVGIPHLNGKFNISISPLSDTKGGLKGFVHIMRNSIEQKRFQTELRQLEKLSALGQLVASIAHEINNPLAAIMGYTQILKGSKDVNEEIKENLERLHSEVERASRIVQNLLTFARKRKIEKSFININEVLRSTIALRAYDLHVNNIAVVEDFQTDLPETIGDPYQLRQVFFNLITNAEYAMKEAHGHGRLEIQTRYDLERSLILFLPQKRQERVWV